MSSAESRQTPPAPVGIDPARQPVGGGFSGLGRPPRRVLFFGKSRSRTRATSGFVEAFAAQGVDVRWVNHGRLRRRYGARMAQRLCRAALRRHRPDLVFAVYPDLPLELLREFVRDVPLAQWVDQPLRGDSLAEVESLSATQVVFMTAPGRFARLRELGVQRLVPMLEAFSPRDHHPGRRHPPEAGALPAGDDLLFIGGPGREGWRARELAELSSSWPLVVHGNGWQSLGRVLGDLRDWPGLRVRGPVKPRGYRRACARARIVLGLNEFNDEYGYFSNRTQLTLACGAFHLTHYVPGLEDVFANREHLVWFHDFAECRELVQEFLAAPAERARIARAGHELVCARHRFVDRIAEVLQVMATGTYLPQPWALAAPAAGGPAGEQDVGASR